MASKKKQSEGIALLSVYYDDEEMEDLEEKQRRQQHQEHEENIEAKKLEEYSGMNGGDDAVAGYESSTPHQPQVNAAVSDSRRRSRGRLTIVDYGHDEVAMSPEHEEGEIDLQDTHYDVRERSPLGSVQASEQLEQQEPDTMSYAMMESETVVVQESAEVTEEEVDPLDEFLPPPPKVNFPEELQAKKNRQISRFKKNWKELQR